MDLTPQRIAEGLTFYVVLLFSLSVHESAHAWAALKNGDDTAAREGRISLNPLVHIDPIGTVLIPLAQIFWGGIPLLGWAKPTPVFAGHFRRLARGHILVAGAGPASNFLLAFLFTAALSVVRRMGLAPEIGGPLSMVLGRAVVLNVALALFNLIPLPPLDGSWIASWGLPRSIAEHYDRIAEPYGQWILMGLFFTGALSWILAPFMSVILAVLSLFT